MCVVPILSDDERRIIRVLNKRVLNKRVHASGIGAPIDIEAVMRWPPKAMIVGEGPGNNTWKSCPLFPYPRHSAGWRLWKMSEMEGQEYLRTFERRNILDTPKWDAAQARVNARSIHDSAARAGTPLVLLGARVASAFGHEHDTFMWNFNEVRTGDRIHYDCAPLVPMVRIPHPSGRNLQLNTPEAKLKVHHALRQALEIHRAPPFLVLHGDQVCPCGTRVGVHERHPTRPQVLRVLCEGDEARFGGRVVFPQGGVQ